jgi:hypothetical protein
MATAEQSIGVITVADGQTNFGHLEIQAYQILVSQLADFYQELGAGIMLAIEKPNPVNKFHPEFK